MAYVVLARRLRPKNFSDVVGHKSIVSSLEASIDENRFHHAFLLTGTRGVGKTTLARIIAKSLNCDQGPTSKPCGACDSCTRIDMGMHEDVIEVDAASRTKVEDTRELIDTIAFAPVSARYKIYIIDEVHMLSNHSFNAILKTVEEPPEHVRFIFATTDPKKLPITLVSRCLRLHLKPLPENEVFSYLTDVLQQENIKYEERAVQYIAEQSNGSMRDALSIIESMLSLAKRDGLTYEVVNDYFGVPDSRLIDDLIDAIAKRNKDKLMSCWAAISSGGLDYYNLLKAMQKRIFSIALEYSEQESNVQGFDISCLHTIYHAIAKSYSEFSSSPDLKISFQMLTLRLMYLQSVFAVGNGNISIFSGGSINAEQSVPGNANKDLPSSYTSYSSTNSVAKPEPVSIPTRKPVAVSEPVNSIEPESSPVVIAKSERDDRQKGIEADVKPTSPTPSTGYDINWRATIKEMKLTGLAKILAQNCAIQKWSPPDIILSLSEEQSPLLSERQVLKLRESLEKHLGIDKISLEINVANGETLRSTPAFQEQEQKKEIQGQIKDEFTKEEKIKKILSRGGTLDRFEINDNQDITI